MFTIFLNDMRIFARHGVYHEEAITGTEFSVSAAVQLRNEKIESLSDTVDYVNVFEIIKKHFSRPVPLLETLAVRIADEVSALNKNIAVISLSLEKLNPPVQGLSGTAGVKITKSYS